MDLKSKSAVITIGAQVSSNPFFDRDMYTAIVCHEVGHALGSIKQRDDFYTEFSELATEGEADYFSTLKCTKRLWKNDDNKKIVESLNVPADIKKQCREKYSNENSAFICMRSIITGFRLFKVGASTLANTPISLKLLESPSENVDMTLSEYPSMQCRMESIRRGALCDIDTYTEDGCTDKETSRPRCWYNPAPECNQVVGSFIDANSAITNCREKSEIID